MLLYVCLFVNFLDLGASRLNVVVNQIENSIKSELVLSTGQDNSITQIYTVCVYYKIKCILSSIHSTSPEQTAF